METGRCDLSQGETGLTVPGGGSVPILLGSRCRRLLLGPRERRDIIGHDTVAGRNRFLFDLRRHLGRRGRLGLHRVGQLQGLPDTHARAMGVHRLRRTAIDLGDDETGGHAERGPAERTMRIAVEVGLAATAEPPRPSPRGRSSWPPDRRSVWLRPRPGHIAWSGGPVLPSAGRRRTQTFRKEACIAQHLAQSCH